MYVRPSTENFSYLIEIWCVGRGWWVMHNSMQYSQIQGQGQGHVALEVSNSFIFKMYFLHHFPWELANDCWFLNQRTISKFVVSLQVFMSPDLELGRKLRCYWYLAITRWVMHNSVLYGLIQGQRQGHVALKVRNSSILKIYIVCHFQWELATDCSFFN